MEKFNFYIKSKLPGVDSKRGKKFFQKISSPFLNPAGTRQNFNKSLNLVVPHFDKLKCGMIPK
ncbi:MAG: hypothetical protein ACI9XO_000299 [Paraglaciecola sp.]